MSEYIVTMLVQRGRDTVRVSRYVWARTVKGASVEARTIEASVWSGVVLVTVERTVPA